VVGQENPFTLNRDKGVSAAHILRRVEGTEIDLGVYSFARRRRSDKVVSLPELEPAHFRAVAGEGNKFPAGRDRLAGSAQGCACGACVRFGGWDRRIAR
jgi:hypothetical protein